MIEAIFHDVVAASPNSGVLRDVISGFECGKCIPDDIMSLLINSPALGRSQTSWNQISISRKCQILGEILLLLAKSPVPNSDVLDRAFDSFQETSVEVLNHLKDEASDDIHRCAIALREWALVGRDLFDAGGKVRHSAQFGLLRAQLSSLALCSRPDLVGEAMVCCSQGLMLIGEESLAIDFCHSLCKDLAYIPDAIEHKTSSEIDICRSALYWFAEAEKICSDLGDTTYHQLGKRAKSLLSKIDTTPIVERLRLGPILAVYLAPPKLMAEFLTRIAAAKNERERFLLGYDFGFSNQEMSIIDRALDHYMLESVPVVENDHLFILTGEAVELVRAQLQDEM